MHDVTEGGVLTAAWELAEASGLGVEVWADAVPVRPETAAVCAALRVDPLLLIGSGAVLVTTGGAERTRSGRGLRCPPATRPEMPGTRRKREMSREQLRRLTETAIAVALVAVLSNVKVYQLPQGGSITAGSMVPIFYIALRWGGPWGLLAGVLAGAVNFITDRFAVHPIQVLLDYPLAFGALGLAGFFRRSPTLGIVVGGAGRWLAHFISGVVFFASYAPKGVSPWVYSAVYNGSYMLPEIVISVVLTVLLLRSLRRLAAAADLLLAADGGTRIARTAGIVPHLIVGDLDSLDAATRRWAAARRIPRRTFSRAKEATDTELALREAKRRGAREVWIYGVVGGRLDQTLANILLLFAARRLRVPARLTDGRAAAWLVDGETEGHGRRDDTVSLGAL